MGLVTPSGLLPITFITDQCNDECCFVLSWPVQVIPMIQKTGSPLLQCLEKLNDDVWEQVLLPKLQEQGSPAAVALSCSQLRRLCQHSIDTLSFRNLTSSSTSAQQLACQATAAAAHFPNCRAVCICAHDETSYWQLPVVLPLLGR
jgi:hypothetical protein